MLGRPTARLLGCLAVRPPGCHAARLPGPAWSGFAIAGHRAVTQEQREENEAVVCYDLRTGSVLWLHTDPGHYKTAIAGEGPRATPTIHDGKVYTLGATGTLNCLELATGNPVWQRHIAADAGLKLDDPVDQTGLSANRNKAKEWGYSSSPLIVDSQVVVSLNQIHRIIDFLDRRTIDGI